MFYWSIVSGGGGETKKLPLFLLFCPVQRSPTPPTAREQDMFCDANACFWLTAFAKRKHYPTSGRILEHCPRARLHPTSVFRVKGVKIFYAVAKKANAPPEPPKDKRSNNPIKSTINRWITANYEEIDIHQIAAWHTSNSSMAYIK